MPTNGWNDYNGDNGDNGELRPARIHSDVYNITVTWGPEGRSRMNKRTVTLKNRNYGVIESFETTHNVVLEGACVCQINDDEERETGIWFCADEKQPYGRANVQLWETSTGEIETLVTTSGCAERKARQPQFTRFW